MSNKQEKHARNASQSQRANFIVHEMLSRAMFLKNGLPKQQSERFEFENVAVAAARRPWKTVKLVNVYKWKLGMTFLDEKKSIISKNLEKHWKHRETCGGVRKNEIDFVNAT